MSVLTKEKKNMDYYISITNRCNLHCEYCYEKKLNTEMGMLDDKTTDAVIEFVNSIPNTGTIYFFGGEPLLGKDIIKKITLQTKANSYIITTNGTLLDEDYIKWCSEHGVKFNVSHDGADLSARGIDPEVLNEKIRILQKYQREILLQLVYTEKTLPKLPDNIRYFRNLGITAASAVLEESTCPADTDAFGDMLLKAWREAASVSGISILEMINKITAITDQKPHQCDICKRKMYINWDGKIYPCLQFQNRAEFQCGDVFNGIDTSRVKQNHPEYSGFPSDCDGCEIKQYCDNSCACRKMATSGTLKAVSDAFCLEQQILTLVAIEKIEEYAHKNELQS